MSAFIGRVPVLRLSLKNQFSGATYPREGFAEAIVDTGYDGFLAAPEGAFEALGLEGAVHSKREAYTADGRRLELRSFPVTANLQGVAGGYDVKLETGAGIQEFLVGTRLLAAFRLTLDYCSGAFRIEPCG